MQYTGGSGYVISKGLLDATFGQSDYGVFRSRWDDFSGTSCCGDMMLALALYENQAIHIKAPDPASGSRFTSEPPHEVRL